MKPIKLTAAIALLVIGAPVPRKRSTTSWPTRIVTPNATLLSEAGSSRVIPLPAPASIV